MSFLHQKEIYIPLVTEGLLKRAAEPGLTPINVGKKLVNTLSRQLVAQPEPLNLASPNEVELKVDNLQSLGTLLKFLSINQVTLDGGRIAYTGAEEAKLPEDEKNKLSPVSINESRDAITRKWNAADYHVNLKSLISYVSYMQQKAAAMVKGGDVQGKVLEVMVGKLIDQVNAIKPDSGLNRKPKSTPEKPNEIDDEEQIDDFGSKVFDPKNPTADRGSLILKAKHIKSRAALNSWLQDSPEAQIVMYDDKNQKQPPKTWTTAGVNHCNVIQVLYARAKYWSEIAKTPKQEKNFAFYVSKIQEIGPTFSGPDGKACTVVPASTSAQPAKPGGEPGKLTPQTIGYIIGSLPLRSDNVNLDRIRAFLKYYAELDPDVANDLVAYHSSAEQDLGQLCIRGTMQREFKLYSDADYVRTLLKDPAANYAAFCEALIRVVQNASDAIDSLYSRYADNTGGKAQISDPQHVQRIADQKQVALNNLNRIKEWRRNSQYAGPTSPKATPKLKY